MKQVFFFILIIPITVTAQKINKLSVGLNVVHFNDWKNSLINLINPEFSYSIGNSKNSGIYFSLSSFNSDRNYKGQTETGKIISRLILNTDIGYEWRISNFSTIAGPSFRYRRDKKIVFLPQSNPFDFLIDPKKSHFDVGGFLNASYGFSINKKSKLSLKAGYKIFSAGINPLSVGLFYERIYKQNKIPF